MQRRSFVLGKKRRRRSPLRSLSRSLENAESDCHTVEKGWKEAEAEEGRGRFLFSVREESCCRRGESGGGLLPPLSLPERRRRGKEAEAKDSSSLRPPPPTSSSIAPFVRRQDHVRH